MPPGTANIAKTLQIRYVSGHAHTSHGYDLRNVTLLPSPNTGNSCGFTPLAGIGVRHGAILVPQTGPYFCANTWKFMLFCLRATTPESQKCNVHLAPHCENPLNYCVLAQNYGSCWGTKWPPTASPEPPTSPKHCKFVVFLDMRTQRMGMILVALLYRRRQTLENMCFCVIGRNRGAPWRHVGLPNGSSF